MTSQKGYEEEFEAALNRTKQWNLKVPEFKPSNQPAITNVSIEEFRLTAQRILGQYQPEQISQQCFQITGFMKDTLEEVLEVPLTITLGYVDFKHKPTFYTPVDELHALIATAPHFDSINLHAWLTTPNFEIIDLTFGTTYSLVNNDPEPLGMLFCQHYSKFNEYMTYHPQLVGEEYLFKISGISNFFLIE